MNCTITIVHKIQGKNDSKEVEFSGSEVYAGLQALEYINFNQPILVIAIRKSVHAAVASRD